MTKEEIKKLLKDSAFWICPDDNELVSINIDRTADKIFKNFLQPDVSGNEAHPKENKKVGEVALPLSGDRFNNYEPSDAEKELANQIYRSGNDR